MKKDINITTTIDGEFEAFKVTMGVKPNLTPAPKAWLQTNWRTIERLVMNENCVLTHKEYWDVFQKGNWRKCFGDLELWNKLIDEQNKRGAWIEDDEQKVLERITNGVNEWKKLYEFGVSESTINYAIRNMKWRMENGYSFRKWMIDSNYDLTITWEKTSREKSNIYGIYEKICDLYKSISRKDNPTEDWIMKHYKVVAGGVGWRPSGGAYWGRAYQSAQLEVENKHRAIVRKFLETKDYGVFGDVSEIMRAKVERAVKAKKIVLAA